MTYSLNPAAMSLCLVGLLLCHRATGKKNCRMLLLVFHTISKNVFLTDKHIACVAIGGSFSNIGIRSLSKIYSDIYSYFCMCFFLIKDYLKFVIPVNSK